MLVYLLCAIFSRGSLGQRLDYANEIMEEVKDSANNPLSVSVIHIKHSHMLKFVPF